MTKIVEIDSYLYFLFTVGCVTQQVLQILMGDLSLAVFVAHCESYFYLKPGIKYILCVGAEYSLTTTGSASTGQRLLVTLASGWLGWEAWLDIWQGILGSWEHLEGYEVMTLTHMTHK